MPNCRDCLWKWPYHTITLPAYITIGVRKTGSCHGYWVNRLAITVGIRVYKTFRFLEKFLQWHCAVAIKVACPISGKLLAWITMPLMCSSLPPFLNQPFNVPSNRGGTAGSSWNPQHVVGFQVCCGWVLVLTPFSAVLPEFPPPTPGTHSKRMIHYQSIATQNPETGPNVCWQNSFINYFSWINGKK